MYKLELTNDELQALNSMLNDHLILLADGAVDLASADLANSTQKNQLQSHLKHLQEIISIQTKINSSKC